MKIILNLLSALLEENKKTLKKIGQKKILKKNEGNLKIKNLFKTKNPFLISRFGTTELNVVCHFLRNNRYKNASFPETLRKNISVLSGFYPEDDASLVKFSRMFLQAVESIDGLGVRWEKFDQEFWLNEKFILKHFCGNAALLGIESISTPFLFAESWLGELQNKKVLVIHPFKKTIESQLERKKTWNQNVKMPDCKIRVLQAEQSLSDHKKFSKYQTWFEALKAMEQEILQADFDVALVGAGAYGLFLGDFCKRLGKTAVHVGGALQLFFGIYGKRWTDKTSPDHIPASFFNEHWVWPSEAEIPQGSHLVEQGCYWK